MVITRRFIEAYLDCKYKARLLSKGNRGDPHDLEVVQAELQVAYRERAADVLLRKYVKSPEAVASAFTNIDIHSGPALVLDALLEDGELAFHFDALRRVDGKSSLGPFHYTPVLFWHGESLRRNLTLLLAVGGLVLARHQDAQPKTGTVLFGGECKARTIQLTNHYKPAQQVIDGLGANEAPRLILNDHCGLCEFRDQCREQAIKTDDLSLLGHMTEKKIDHYAQTGTLTVTQLSYTFHARRHRNAHPKQNPRSLPLHALAIRQKRILVVGKPAFPKTAVRIFFDAEGDFDRRFTYLLGLLMVTDGHEEMISLWADDPSQQKRLFEQFVGVLRQYDGYALFHYGQYEAEILRKMRAVVRVKKTVDAAIAASVNVLAPLHSDVYFPTYSNGLKDIGKYLGLSWTDRNASGLQSLAWRERWEMTGQDEFKQKLVTYNSEDCHALRRVTETLEAIGQGQQSVEGTTTAWEEVKFEPDPRTWGEITFLLPEFDYINKCAYFEYQRDRVFVRVKPRRRRTVRRQRKQAWLRPNEQIELSITRCPNCKTDQIAPCGKRVYKKQVLDVVPRPSGMVRRVIEYRAARVWCKRCNRVFLPPKYRRLNPYRHGLRSWAMFQHVEHQVSLPRVAAMIEAFFGLHLDIAYVHMMKAIMVRYYQKTSKRLLEKLLAGSLIHVDETQMKLRKSKGYVWVLSNMEEVVYIYRPNREVGFLKGLLAGFQGVLVSDFFSGYDGMACRQQKCLIHLIRDMNSDLRKNPFDDELKGLIGPFGTLLSNVVKTIDRHGLKADWLARHLPKAKAYLERVCNSDYHSVVAQSYKERFVKNRDKLFTFLECDGVPWNNNNAEYAIKQFSHYREGVEGSMVESGINDYLALLSICVTCEFKGASFLRFLLSKQRDIDAFKAQGHVEAQKRRIELYPKGFPGRSQKQHRLSQQESEQLAETMGLADLFTSLMIGLKRYFYQVQGSVSGIRFLGKAEKGQSYLTMIRLLPGESSAEQGLRYIADLSRLSAYFGIEKTVLRSVLPAHREAQGGGVTGYFKDMAEVNTFLETINAKGQRAPHRIRRRIAAGRAS